MTPNGLKTRESALKHIWSTRDRPTNALYREPFSLVHCRIVTGRTHQIRVHLEAVGAPLLGDALYGDPAWNRRMGGLAPRPLLHARRLRFRHPTRDGGPWMEFLAPVPEDILVIARQMEPFDGAPETLAAALGG